MFSLSAASAALTPFDGTWRIVPDQSRFAPAPHVAFLSEGWYHCTSCNPQLDIKADGTDQPVLGQAFDTFSVREINSKSIQLIAKKAGVVLVEQVETVSNYGKTLTVKTTQHPTSGGPVVTAETTAVRVGIAPARINSISGKWRLASMKSSENALLITYTSNGNQLVMTQPTGESYTANFDGKDYPAKGAIAYNTVSLRRFGQNTFEETSKRDGAVVNIARVSIAPGGKKMTIVQTNRLTGRTTTYIAVKQ